MQWLHFQLDSWKLHEAPALCGCSHNNSLYYSRCKLFWEILKNHIPPTQRAVVVITACDSFPLIRRNKQERDRRSEDKRPEHEIGQNQFANICESILSLRIGFADYCQSLASVTPGIEVTDSLHALWTSHKIWIMSWMSNLGVARFVHQFSTIHDQTLEDNSFIKDSISRFRLPTKNLSKTEMVKVGNNPNPGLSPQFQPDPSLSHPICSPFGFTACIEVEQCAHLRGFAT